MSKSTAIMLGLIAFAVLGAPAIFIGLVAMSEAGLFEDVYDNFLLFAGALVAIVLGIWTAMLWIGSRALATDKADAMGEQLDG